ncbi:hypothetical protein DL770_007439 [Monosporascus sp. CRB-9-2]|nr:hypothetical protein DL770_007439 [Monosporascus sp. CRB-9-2]
MGGGNGAKSAQKRERAKKKNAKTGPSSQLKTNQKFNAEYTCTVCRQPYNHTVPEAQFIEHAKATDRKDPRLCFPTYPFTTI